MYVWLAGIYKIAQPTAAAPAPPVVVLMNGLSDLLPESYSGDDSLIDTEEFLSDLNNG